MKCQRQDCFVTALCFVSRNDGLTTYGSRGVLRPSPLSYIIATIIHHHRFVEKRLRYQKLEGCGLTECPEKPGGISLYALPLTDYIYDLLQGLWDHRKNEYVFPGRKGHIVEPKRQIAKISEMSQISFMLTDLRRTFITIAESLDLSYYAVKRLLNHKIKGDVTTGYIVVDVERLRKPMQQIMDYILEKAGITPDAETADSDARAAKTFN